MAKKHLVEKALYLLKYHNASRNPVAMTKHGMHAFCDWGNTFEEIDEAVEAAYQRLVKQGQTVYNLSEDSIESAIYRMTKDGFSPAQTKIRMMSSGLYSNEEGYVDAIITEATRRLGIKNDARPYTRSDDIF